ncbi:MAG: hypothetical protein QM820_01535 [Minicystis sp.]
MEKLRIRVRDVDVGAASHGEGSGELHALELGDEAARGGVEHRLAGGERDVEGATEAVRVRRLGRGARPELDRQTLHFGARAPARGDRCDGRVSGRLDVLALEVEADGTQVDLGVVDARAAAVEGDLGLGAERELEARDLLVGEGGAAEGERVDLALAVDKRGGAVGREDDVGAGGEGRVADVEEAEVSVLHADRGEPDGAALDVGDDLLRSLAERNGEAEGERLLARGGRGRRRGGAELGRERDDEAAVGAGDLQGAGTEVEDVGAAMEAGVHPLDANSSAGIENEVCGAGGAEEGVAERACQERPGPRSARERHQRRLATRDGGILAGGDGDLRLHAVGRDRADAVPALATDQLEVPVLDLEFGAADEDRGVAGGEGDAAVGAGEAEIVGAHPFRGVRSIVLPGEAEAAGLGGATACARRARREVGREMARSPGLDLAEDDLARADRGDEPAAEGDGASARAVRDLNLIEVDAGARDLGELDVDAPEPHAVVRRDDGLDLDAGPVPPGDLVGLEANHGPERRDDHRAHDAAGKRGQLESPGNHRCRGYQRPARRKPQSARLGHRGSRAPVTCPRTGPARCGRPTGPRAGTRPRAAHRVSIPP